MKKVDLFYTPTSMKDLEDRLESYSGSEFDIKTMYTLLTSVNV